MARRKTTATDTEEDGFIEAIGAAPEDEALRLVYADWLEDHGKSAHSAYLRTEVEFFRPPRRKKKLTGAWTKSKEFDPVWAAMVSRPPHGILRPGLTFSSGGPPLSRNDLKSLEEHWGASLPPDYAAFLLLHNGGRPGIPNLQIWCAGPDDPAEIEGYEPGLFSPEVYLYSLGEKDETGVPAHWTSAAGMCAEHDSSVEARITARLMLIGTLTDLSGVDRLFMDVDAGGYNKYVQLSYNHEQKKLTTWDVEVFFPNTFTELLCNLEY
jgi:uncharacterized protein (TIGR02996 family)